MEYKFNTNGKVTELMAYDDSFFSSKFDKKEGRWVKCLTMATSKTPYAIITTSNYNERELLTALRRNKDAKCVKTWTRGNFTDDNYGRPHREGTINCSLWDLRSAFGITEPLEDFLDYETREFYLGNAPMIY